MLLELFGRETSGRARAEALLESGAAEVHMFNRRPYVDYPGGSRTDGPRDSGHAPTDIMLLGFLATVISIAISYLGFDRNRGIMPLFQALRSLVPVAIPILIAAAIVVGTSNERVTWLTRQDWRRIDGGGWGQGD